MKIESGRYYRTRDGQKVGPMRRGEGAARYWEADGQLRNGANSAWYESGCFWPMESIHRDKENAGYDLIAEWTDTPDLTDLTTPFGLLDRETQEALMAHGGPYECWSPRQKSWGDVEASFFSATVYRVKPAPPKPRTIYLVECAPCGPAMVCQTAIEATKVALIHSGAKISEWAEVITE